MDAEADHCWWAFENDESQDMKGLTYVVAVLALALFGVGASVALADNGNGNGGNPPGPINSRGPSEHGVYDASGVFQGCEHNGGGSGNCGQNQSGNGGDHGYGKATAA